MADIKHDRPQEFGSFAAWVGSGVRRRWRAIVWTFVVTYTLLPVVILVTVVLLVVVVLQRLFGGGGSTTVDPVTGAVVHAAGPSLGSAFVLFPVALISTLVSVVLVGGIALALLYGGVVFEPASLRIRGYRRPTMAEKARLDAALAALRGEMRLGNVPVVWVWDTVEAVAAARARSLVVSSALLAVAPDERGESLLRGVLAHELAHWRRADYLADRAVWAVGWLPLLMYRLGAIAGGWDTTPLVSQSRTRSTPPAQKQWFGVLIGWGLLWPAWLVIRLVMVPLSMPVARRGSTKRTRRRRTPGVAGIWLGCGSI